jgi:uncharacterized membrane protein
MIKIQLWPQRGRGRVSLGLVIFVFLALAARAEPGVSSKVTTENGKTLVTLSNPFVELVFEPALGGRCTGFRLLDNGEQLVAKSNPYGFFLDHWAKYIWPSGLMHLPYQYEIVGDGKTTVGIKLWTTVPATGGGVGSADEKMSKAIPTSPDLVGLIVQKTILLHADRDVIDVDEEIINPLKESRGAGLYIQHNFNMNGSPYHNVWYFPSTRGIDLRIMRDKEGDADKGVDWVLDPTAGWIAVRDAKTNRGLLFAFDYNYIDRLYTSGSSAEWFMDTVPVAPGKSFKTSYVIKPIRDFEGVVYGSKRIVADLQMREEAGGKVHVTSDIAAVSGAIPGVQIEFTATGWKSKAELFHQTFKLERLPEAKVRQEFSFAAKDLTDGVVVRALVVGPGWEEKYETYYDGEKKEEQRRTNLWATKGGALPGTKGEGYFHKPPRKIKQFDKPVLSQVPRPSPDHFKCLVVFGLFTHVLNLDDALADWKADSKYPVEFNFLNCPPNGVEKFPATYDDLFSYNVVVLSDVNYKAIGAIGFEMLCDYVEQGGNLLIVGGPYALGDGEFEETRFLDILPVKLSGPFDLKWAGKGKSWALTAAGKSPITEGLTFEQAPKVFWQHFVTPKAGAEVILTAGGQPSLVVGHYGKGKIAVLTLSPTGVSESGETAWWEWKQWPQLLKNIFQWFNQK